eukprot:TRINITY_DN26521_c0_g1_i3.p1 TRINITY_DN26521_c0_g1~~TRINITY_DN26521_c0_g1_i3.p1  ORF type:complete len:391 (-),score=41.98 TRINITY_DN26521_c0_g1_i3:54-1226(-)
MSNTSQEDDAAGASTPSSGKDVLLAFRPRRPHYVPALDPHELQRHSAGCHSQALMCKVPQSDVKTGRRSQTFSEDSQTCTRRLRSKKADRQKPVRSCGSCSTRSVDTTASTAPSSPAEACSIKHWKCGALIGQGSYGSVFKGLELRSGTVFALKKTLIQDRNSTESKHIEKFEGELEILKHLRHPNIVSFFGHEVKDGELCIFMEYMPGGSLSSMLSEFGPLPGQLLQKAALGMLHGLDYLHRRNPPVIHRDIKSANVLVDAEFTVKLSDFGCSKRCDVSTSFTTVGSIPWMAPEVINISQDHGYGRKADIWSLGCTIIELATAEPPWGRGAFDNVLFALKRIGMTEELPPVPAGLPQPLEDIVKSCLQRRPSLRPSASDVLCAAFSMGV